MNDEKEGIDALNKVLCDFVKHPKYTELAKAISSRLEAHGKAMFERGRQNYCDECKEVCENLSDESDRLKEGVAELERTRT